MIESIAALVFTALTAIVIIFQGCLAAGLPWGEASMGGRYPGKYPPKMRIVAVLNMLLLGFIAAIVLSQADLAFLHLRPIASFGIWFVVVFFSIVTVINTVTPSKIERIWAPVAFIQMITSFIVAIG